MSIALPVESVYFQYFLKILILLAVYMATRLILYRLVKGWAVRDYKAQQSWFFLAKRLPSLILMLGILFIWGHELRDFALSLVAVAAALVLATKEILLCFMGGLLRASSKLFEIGDRITVSGFRGKVVEQNLLTTMLLEIGPGVRSNQNTGKMLKLPNSLFLSHAVTVVPSGHDYILHVITVTMPFNSKWQEMEILLKECAIEVFAEFERDFKSFANKNKELVKNHALGQEPRVIFDLNSKDTMDFQVRMTIPYEGLSRTEHLVIRKFLKKVTDQDLLSDEVS